MNDFIIPGPDTNNFKNKKKQKNISQINKNQKQQQISKANEELVNSFYDSFFIVDRMTNNKISFKDVRRCSASINKKKSSKTNQNQKQAFLSSMQIYKKTKKFQMKSLKQRIYKNVEIADNDDEKQNEKSKKNQLKKDPFILHRSSNNSRQISRNKKQYRSFIQKTIHQINKNQLRIQKKSSHKLNNKIIHDLPHKAEDEKLINNQTQKQVIELNKNKLMLKNYLKKEQISKMMELKQKQESIINQKTDEFKIKNEQNHIKFKTFKSAYISSGQTKQTKDAQSPQQKNYKQLKLKQNQVYIQKFFNQIHNKFIKEDNYLIRPSKQHIKNQMLFRKRRKDKYVHLNNSYIFDQLHSKTIDISNCQFKKTNENNQSESKVKYSFFRNHQIYSQSGHINANIKQSEDGKVFSKQQKNVVNLLKKNFIRNFIMQLKANNQIAKKHDQKGNNILHIAIDTDKFQALQSILKNLPYKLCKLMLEQKNRYKKTPRQYAQLLHRKKILDIIDEFYFLNKKQQFISQLIKQKQRAQQLP